MSNNKGGIRLKKLSSILLVILFILISNYCYFDECLHIKENDNEVITENTVDNNNYSLKGFRNIYLKEKISLETKREVFIPHRNENEIIDIVFHSIKNVSQLARCKLDKQTYVLYNIA